MTSGRRQHRRSLLLACSACTLLVALLHHFSGNYRDLAWKVRDQLAVSGKRSPASPEVIFLAIDNASVTLDLTMKDDVVTASPALQLMRQGFPYPRDLYPLIMERLIAAGAKVVVFDMLFPVEKKETDPPFAAALEKYRDHVVIGSNLESREQGERDDDSRIRHTIVPPTHSLIPPGPDPRVGFVNFWSDPDGVVRRARYLTSVKELDDPRIEGAEDFHSLVARAMEQSGHAARVPTTRDPLLFRFAEEIRPFSLYEIFVPSFWDQPPYNSGALFRDKIVLIGPDGNWIKDELRTPFGDTLGPRIHLSALNAALAGDYLIEPPAWLDLLLILLGGAVAWSLGRFVSSPLWRFLLLIGLTAGLFGLAQAAYNLAGIFPIVFSPLAALVTSGLSFSIAEQVLERLEKSRLRQQFESFVSRDVVKELLDNPDSYLNTIGGQRKSITVFFSDLRGFTALTETADAQLLVEQLNEYFTEMVRIVFAHRGTLDKFIGDAVMAQWGALVSAGDEIEARRAVAAALEMRIALVRLNEDWKARGFPELKAGMGINHGEAIVGKLGSDEKREFSAIGDAVNLASRLEGATKLFGTDLLIGENVAPLVRDAFLVRTVDLLRVAGRARPIEVFTVLAPREPSAPLPAWLQHHEEGIRHYRARLFHEAAASFTAALSLQPSDWLAADYLRRSIAYSATPPPPDWDGVFVLANK